MGSIRLVLVALLAPLLALTASPSRAIEWIADRDIASYCQQFLTRPNSPSGAVCLSYIQGFLDGLRTTETPAFSLPEEAGYSDVSERESALHTAERMNALVEEFGPPARAGICLPEGISSDELARVVARALRYGRSSGRSALDDYAQAALQERFPCDTSDPMQARQAMDDEFPAREPLQDTHETGAEDGESGEESDRAALDNTLDEDRNNQGDDDQH